MTRRAAISGAAALMLLAACSLNFGSTQQELVPCPHDPTKWCTEYAWDGGYHYVDNNCHNAANCALEAGNQGIINCAGYTEGPYGHTVVWDVPEEGSICVSGPYGGNVACCWSGDAPAEGGTPDLSSQEAQDCLEEVCAGQYDADAGVGVLDAGVPWDVDYTDCAAAHPGDVSACEACCDQNADAVPDSWGDAGISDREEYRERCKQDCNPTPDQDAGTPPQDAGSPTQDAGTPTQDAGTPTQDAGTPTQDAG